MEGETIASRAELLATLGRELRCPLAPMLAALQLMRLREDDPATQRRSRDLLDQKVRCLARLADDLVAASRPERGALERGSERAELGSAHARAVREVQPRLEAQERLLSLVLPEERVPLAADPARLARLLTTLVESAGEPVAPGGLVTVRAARAGNEAVVRVRRTGGAATGGRTRGGLGLALARILAESVGGSVEAPGDGRELTLRVPGGEL